MTAASQAVHCTMQPGCTCDHLVCQQFPNWEPKEFLASDKRAADGSRACYDLSYSDPAVTVRGNVPRCD